MNQQMQANPSTGEDLGSSVEPTTSAGGRPRPGEILSLLIFGLHGWSLLLSLPRTLYRVAEALLPGGGGLSSGELWAFGVRDAAFRPWYNKIARDYHERGRFGIAWDDGLGMPLGVRIYNNWATYALLFHLGTRRLMLLGYVLMVTAVGLVCGIAFGPWGGAAAALTVAGSPLVVISYTHLGKPEVIWWGPALGALALAFGDPTWHAGLVWSALALVNVPVAVLLGIMVGPALALIAGQAGTLHLLALGCIPGVVKGGFRAWQMWRSGFFGTLATEQSRLVKFPLTPTRDELLWMIPFVASVSLSSYHADAVGVGALVIVGGTALYWLNFRVMYVNDPQSFRLAFLSIAVAASAMWGSIIGVVVAILGAYHHPRFCRQPDVPPTVPGERRWARLGRVPRAMIASFPAVVPSRLKYPAPLAAFLESIPDGARIVAESDGDPRSGSAFRAFWTWSEEVLPRRGIDLVNEMYTRLVEPDLVQRYLLRFNAREMRPPEMSALCEALGVSHIVAYSDDMAENLTEAGFTRLATVDLTPLTEFRNFLSVPATQLILLETPFETGIVSPCRSIRYDRSTLSFKAEVGQSYVVRFRMLSGYEAMLEDEQLEILPLRPLPDCSLTFMRIAAPREGNLTLRFQSPWWAAPRESRA